MGKAETDEIEVKTIGDVKAPLDVWSAITTYKTQQRVHGRKLTMPESLIELAEKQLKLLRLL
jgi:hypothetical protein